MSTASVTAAEMARATPEPIWNAVFSCDCQSYCVDGCKRREAYHSAAQTFNVNRNGSQNGGASGDENKRYSGDADE